MIEVKNKVSNQLIKKMDMMGHEQVVFCTDSKTGLKAIIAIHSTILGPALGGTRMWNYIDEEDAFDFVEQSNNHFNPAAKVHPFFLDVDRSFATYLVVDFPADRTINVSLSTEKPPIYDKVKLKQKAMKND